MQRKLLQGRLISVLQHERDRYDWPIQRRKRQTRFAGR